MTTPAPSSRPFSGYSSGPSSVPPSGSGAPRLIRLRTSRDALALVPRLLGHRPRRSIVFLNLHPGGTVSTMRVDLPEPAAQGVERRLIAQLVGLLSKVPEVQKTVIAVYTDERFDAGGDVPRASFVRPLVRRLLGAGFAVHDALCVARDAWGPYDGHDAGVAHRLDELDEPAPGDDAAPLPSAGVEELTALPMVGELARGGFRHSLARQLRTRELFEPVAEAEEALALAPETATSDELAALLRLLMVPDLRDVVLYTWAWGAERGAELLAEGERIAAGELGPDDDSIGLDLMGLRATAPPDRERVERGIGLMSRVAALASEDGAAVALTVLAWLHWSQGRGSVAGRFVDRARSLDPAYGLAELLDTVLAAGALPEWAYLRPEAGRARGVG